MYIGFVHVPLHPEVWCRRQGREVHALVIGFGFSARIDAMNALIAP